ncbi:TIM barrel protein [Nocardia beijingensis]|uniref:TIM barrel protein n=1 Tax=Nocardia beijingensis TaxID=95162 RepID=UPI0018939EE9|nr:TIM barrel protein [Nocardia beijingensis]MBF6466678.1 TIM barrel protein [Nocardia beijingensis]
MTETLYPLRVAAAPISWGVCEVPGWGHVLDARTVLGEMAALGLTATELGPPGYLPDDPVELRRLLKTFGLTAVGGFLAVVLHRERQDAVARAEETAALLAAAGADVLVLAAATGFTGYDARTQLDGSQWSALVDTAAAIRDIAAAHGVRTVLHPHVGTHVESEAEVERFLADSDLDICLDTGHLLIGGTDPVRLAARHAERIGHVHLKDVRGALADQIRGGKLEYGQAVRRGLYVPLGAGDVDIAALVHSMRAAGYRGWYVLEQDAVLRPGDSARQACDDTGRSLRHLADIALAAAGI